MKYSIKFKDSSRKIYIDEEANIGQFVEELNNLFPDGKWTEFSLVKSCKCEKAQSACCSSTVTVPYPHNTTSDEAFRKAYDITYAKPENITYTK